MRSAGNDDALTSPVKSGITVAAEDVALSISTAFCNAYFGSIVTLPMVAVVAVGPDAMSLATALSIDLQNHSRY